MLLITHLHENSNFTVDTVSIFCWNNSDHEMCRWYLSGTHTETRSTFFTLFTSCWQFEGNLSVINFYFMIWRGEPERTVSYEGRPPMSGARLTLKSNIFPPYWITRKSKHVVKNEWASGVNWIKRTIYIKIALINKLFFHVTIMFTADWMGKPMKLFVVHCGTLKPWLNSFWLKVKFYLKLDFFWRLWLESNLCHNLQAHQ